jgi:hypothetical protein
MIFGIVIVITVFKTIFFDLIAKCCCSNQEPTVPKDAIGEEIDVIERS